MSFFANKHVIIALVTAPILAVLTYYVVGLWAAEEPHKAVKGQSYQLVAKSNCRYASGQCDLVNGTFKSSLVIKQNNVLELTSSHPLQQVMVGFGLVQNHIETAQPQAMLMQDDSQKTWLINIPEAQVKMPIAQLKEHKAMLAILSDGTYYYAETPLGFGQAQAEN